jgi:hypothetical protein
MIEQGTVSGNSRSGRVVRLRDVRTMDMGESPRVRSSLCPAIPKRYPL